MNRMVQTVLGPAAPAELGITDGHNHLWIAPVVGNSPGLPVLDDVDGISRELSLYRQAGGGAIVDCQPVGCGRDGRMLAQLSRASQVHIVACTGFHLRRYYPEAAEIWQLSSEAAAQLFIEELGSTLRETAADPNPVRAGFIKIAAEERFSNSPLPLFEAAAEACRATGCAVEIHTERGADVEALLGFFSNQDVLPDRLIFCHVDKRPDFAFHQTIAQSGAMLEYDTFYRSKYQPEAHLWPLLEKMIAAGLGRQLVLATDMADWNMWQLLGEGPGLAGFIQIKTRLSKMGVESSLIDDLVGGNISRRLAMPLTWGNR